MTPAKTPVQPEREAHLGIYNMGDVRGKTIADIKALRRAGAQGLILSETLDRKTLLRAYAQSEGLEIVATSNMKGGWETVIMFDPETLPVTGRWVHPAVGPYTRHDLGAGGRHGIPAKATPHVRLWRGDYRVQIFGAHLIPSSRIRARQPFYDMHIRALLRDARPRKGGIVFGGDFNLNPGHPRLSPLWRAGYRQQVHGATHGRHWQPDHLWTKGVDLRVQEMLKLSSDHKAVLFTVKPIPIKHPVKTPAKR